MAQMLGVLQKLIFQSLMSHLVDQARLQLCIDKLSPSQGVDQPQLLGKDHFLYL
jgi:hypothetical protein